MRVLEGRALLDASATTPPPLPSLSRGTSTVVYSLLNYIVPLLLFVVASTYVLAYYVLSDNGASTAAVHDASFQRVRWSGASLLPQHSTMSLPSSPFTASPLLKTLPEHRALLPSVCGAWMADYAAFHASVCSDSWFVRAFVANGSAFPPPQLLVFHINTQRTTGGISDRWPILSTAMIVALLTRRALLFDWEGHDAAYAHPHLPYIANTTWQTVYLRWRWYAARVDTFRALLANGTPTALWPSPPLLDVRQLKEEPGHILRARTHDYQLTFEGLAAAPYPAKMQSLAELRSYYPQHAAVVIFVSSYGGKGLTHYFYQSEALRRELEAMGLRQAVCHGCLVNFVVHVNAAVQRLFEPFAWQLVPREQLTVGLQLRLGDVSMKGKGGLTDKERADLAWQDDDTQLLKYAASFIACARQLVGFHRDSEQQPVLLFIVSDSVRMRSLLQRHVNRSLVIPAEPPFVIGHTDAGDKGIFHNNSALRASDVQRYLQVAAGEQWLLAWCDFLVVDHVASGFGRSAALRSIRLGRSFDGRKTNIHRCDADGAALTVDDWEKIGHKY